MKIELRVDYRQEAGSRKWAEVDLSVEGSPFEILTVLEEAEKLKDGIGSRLTSLVTIND